MAISISNAYIQTFEANVRMLAQQGNTLLRQFVTEVQNESESHNWDRLAAAAARSKSSARMVSPAGGDGSGAVSSTDGLAWTRRKSLIATYDAGEVVEKEDPRQMLIDPNAPITEALAMAMKRKIDDLIIAAATGASRDGDGGSVAWSSSYDVGGSTTVISLDTLVSIQEAFLENNVDPDEKKVLVISPVQYRTLMNIEKLTSADYQMIRSLSTGRLDNFMGFHAIVISNRLAAPATGQINCLAFTRKGIGLHIAKDIWARVGERTDMSFAWQFYTAMSVGAIRVEDEHVIRVHLKDAQS